MFDGVMSAYRSAGTRSTWYPPTVSAWGRLDVDVVRGRDGALDFRGPAVHGRPGDRFLYLTSGRVHDGTFDMFRRAKLMLSAVSASRVD